MKTICFAKRVDIRKAGKCEVSYCAVFDSEFQGLIYCNALAETERSFSEDLHFHFKAPFPSLLIVSITQFKEQGRKMVLHRRGSKFVSEFCSLMFHFLPKQTYCKSM